MREKQFNILPPKLAGDLKINISNEFVKHFCQLKPRLRSDVLTLMFFTKYSLNLQQFYALHSDRTWS